MIATGYGISLLITLFMYFILSQSWNFLSGYTGYVSFGHVGFFGTGAYAAAIFITRYKVHWILASLLGGGTASLLALLIGWPTLRLKGPYFAIVMLGVAGVMKNIAVLWKKVTLGGMGISLPPVLNIKPVYYFMFVCAFMITLLIYIITKTKFGLRLVSIREDETAATSLGINTTYYKIITFLISAFFAGIAGAIFAPYSSYIDPSSSFDITVSIEVIIMSLLGGAGTVSGPLFGAAILVLGGEILWSKFPLLHDAFLGITVVLVILFLPEGIMGLLNKDKSEEKRNLLIWMLKKK
jgi:branched-chain amino acid transport system permease protein